MSDWQVGDLALCVKLGPWCSFYHDSQIEEPGADGPKPGSVNRVIAVSLDPDNLVCLKFAEFPDDSLNDYGFCASRFRKITPPEADEFDREVIDLLTKQPAEAI